jgi:hypothetical protein
MDMPQPSTEEWRNYKDLFVIAFPTPKGDTGKRLIPSIVKSNRLEVELDKCIKEQTKVTLKPSDSEPAIIDIDFHCCPLKAGN